MMTKTDEQNGLLRAVKQIAHDSVDDVDMTTEEFTDAVIARFNDEHPEHEQIRGSRAARDRKVQGALDLLLAEIPSRVAQRQPDAATE
jgi:hypothetical protein